MDCSEAKAKKVESTFIKPLVCVLTTPMVRFMGFYWTLGRYDRLVIMEAPNEKAVMKANMSVNGIVATETMVGVTREEAHKLL